MLMAFADSLVEGRVFTLEKGGTLLNKLLHIGVASKACASRLAAYRRPGLPRVSVQPKTGKSKTARSARMVASTPPLAVSSTKGKGKGDGDLGSSSGRGTPKSKKKKAVPETPEPLPTLAEEPDGLAGAPLLSLAIGQMMECVSAKACQLRAEFDLTSDKAGELPAAAVVHVIEQRPTADGAVRMNVVPQGQLTSIGWLTGVTKDGKKNMSVLGRPVLEVIAAKALAAREAFALTSGKAGELAVGAFVHLLEAKQTADGAYRVSYAMEGTETVRGWVTAITKDGNANFALVKDYRAHKASDAAGGGSSSDDPAAPTGATPRASPGGKGKGKAASIAPPAAADASGDMPAAVAKLLAASRVVGSIIATKPALVRAGVELNSDKVGELAPGSSVLIVEERENPDGSKRACLSLLGQLELHGWITSLTGSGAQNLKAMGRGLVEVTATKPLQARAEFELTSGKAGELPAAAMVHLLDVRRTADGAWRVAYAMEGEEVGGAKGWVTAVTKDGVVNMRPKDVGGGGTPRISPDKGKKAVATSRAAGKGLQSPRSSTQRVDLKPSAASALKDGAAGDTKESKDLALKNKRAREEEQQKAIEANEKRAFEEKAKKVAEEKAKKAEQERKKAEEVQKKIKKEAEDKRLEAERREAEEKARAKKEYEAKAAADKAERAKFEAEKQAKLEQAAKLKKQEAMKERENERKEKEAAEKKAAEKASAAASGGEQTDEEKAAAEAMKNLLGNTTNVIGLQRYDRNEQHRPHGRPEGQPSRHESVLEPATMVLMFNCYRSSFELLKGDITTLPDAEALEIRSVKSLQSIGRCKIAPHKGTEFVDRIEFSNEWRVGAEHGLVHDGLQGDGSLELRLDWKHENEEKGTTEAKVALISVNPWLAYGCSEGARLSMRKAGALEGKCATVQRALRDDSVVVRIDGMVGESTVDPSPLAVVSTTSPRHQPNTPLLFVYENAAVDAEVMEWGMGQGKDAEVFDIKEGSRHRLLVQGSTMTGWVTVTKKDSNGVDQDNLKPAKPDDPEAEGQLIVCAAKPLIVRMGFSQETEKVGTIAPRTIVNVLETRLLEDGTQRSMVSSLAGEAILITAALNEFNHSVQRFKNVAEFEAARLNYLEDIVEREAMVEDAITG